MNKIEFQRNLLFGYLTCKRLYPNYIFFSKQYNFGNSDILNHYLLLIKSSIVNPNLSLNLGDFRGEIDKITPVPHEYDTVLASSAMDACAGVFELISFIQDKNPEHIESIKTAATDSVDMFIQEKEGWSMEDPQFEEKISFHPLMVNERKRQQDILNYLAKIDSINEGDVETLEKLQDNEGMGNLDL